MAARRKSLASGPLKQADKQVTTLQTTTLVIIVAAPPPVGAVGSKVVSTDEAWDYSQRATKFLEGLMNREAIRKVILFPLHCFNHLIPLTDS
jgi:hypothetical protein